MRTALLGLLGGGLLACSTPPAVFAGAELLVLPGLALFVELARRDKPWLGLFLYGVVLIGWVGWSLRHVVFAGYACMPPVAGLYMIGIGAALRLYERRWGAAIVPFAFALLWTLWELVRSGFPTIPYPHGQVAHALYHWPALLAPVRILGETGMNFLVALLAGSLWALVRLGWRRAWRPLALTLVLWGGASVPLPELPPDGAPLRVALVQPGFPSYRDQPGFADLERPEAVLERYRELSAEIGECDLVVWPESLPWTGQREGEESAGLRFLTGVLSRPGASVAFGAGRTPEFELGKKDREPRHMNVAFLCGPAGTLLGVREKRILAPIGEMVPWWLAWLRLFFPQLRDVLEGRELPLPRLPDARGVGLPICFENAFPGPFRALAAQGAGFYVVPSWEGWYRGGAELDQMLAMTVFRALETGRPVVRATNDGFTGHVGPDGVVRALLPVGPAAVLAVEVQPRGGSTPAMRWGEAVSWAMALLAVGLLLAGFRRRAPPGGGPR